MVFEKVKNFLTVNLVEGGPLNELGNNLLGAGLFLWGGRSVKVLNTGEIQQQNIPSILERNWINPIVWVKTAVAIILFIPCTILALGTKWNVYNHDRDLRGMYDWAFYNLKQKTKEESIDDYCHLDPNYFTETLTTKEKFLSATAEKPILRAILSFHLSKEKLKNWGLEEEISFLVQKLSEEDLCKALNYFSNEQIILNLFERVPHEKIFSLVKDPLWKDVLLCTVPDKEEILDELVRYLQPKDRLNFFSLGGVPTKLLNKNIFIPYPLRLTPLYPLRLLPYMIKTMTIDDIKKAGGKPVVKYFYDNLLAIRSPEFHQLNPSISNVIIPDHFIFILRHHSPQLAFLIYPLKELIIPELAQDFAIEYPSQTNIDYSSIAESICSFETFVRWIKVKGKSAGLLYLSRIGWLGGEIDIALNNRGVNARTTLSHSAFLKINAFFEFLEALFKSDLSKGYPILINRYLKAADRELVLDALCNEESTYKVPSLFDTHLRGIFESKTPRTGLPEDLVDELELLDLLEGSE